MSPDAYRKRLASLDLTQEQAGELFGASARSGQRWASEGPPLPVAIVLLLVGNDRAKLDRIADKLAIKWRARWHSHGRTTQSMISVAVLAIAIGLRGGFSPTPLDLVVVMLIAVIAGAWVFGCTADKVRHHGEAYALALFEAIETVVAPRRGQRAQ
jgi:hypothetical protein